LFLIGQQGLGLSSGIGPCFPLAGGLVNFVRQRQRKMTMQQQANSLLSMHNYTLHVISGNDNNKQLTLLSQFKLTFTGRNI
jgi:hypothetical protein